MHCRVGRQEMVQTVPPSPPPPPPLLGLAGRPDSHETSVGYTAPRYTSTASGTEYEPSAGPARGAVIPCRLSTAAARPAPPGRPSAAGLPNQCHKTTARSRRRQPPATPQKNGPGATAPPPLKPHRWWGGEGSDERAWPSWWPAGSGNRQLERSSALSTAAEIEGGLTV